MGKGSKQPQDQTVVQTNLPKYVKPYFERLLKRTEAESKQEYNPYTGQRLAGESDTLQSRQNIRTLRKRNSWVTTGAGRYHGGNAKSIIRLAISH